MVAVRDDERGPVTQGKAAAVVTDNGGTCEPELSDSLKTFGAVLKALREEARLTQEQFAPLVRYSVAYIA